MTYNAGSRLVTSVEGAVVSTYTFDANGNQTAVNAGGSRTTMAYDYENRMRTAIDPGGARSTLAYWADGMRRFLEVGGTRTTFVWDGSDYLQSRTPSDVTTFSTVDAQILDSETGGSESLLVPDPLGSVVKVLDASGNQLYDAWYWAYGETRLSVGVNNTPWGYGGTWGYHFDMSRRLYIRARVLDPVTGRWYSVDPLWPAEHAFAYANGLPTSYADPTGYSVEICVRPLKAPLPETVEFGHWFFNTSSCGARGYEQGGLTPGWSANLGGFKANCYSLPVTPAQENCICRESASPGLRAGLWLPGEGYAYGFGGAALSPPGSEGYDAGGHNCQDFVHKIIEVCMGGQLNWPRGPGKPSPGLRKVVKCGPPKCPAR